MKISRDAAKWAVIIVLSVVLGIALVQYLVAPPLFMAAYLLLCVVVAAGLALIVFVAVARSGEGSRSWSCARGLSCRIPGNYHGFPEPGRGAAPG